MTDSRKTDSLLSLREPISANELLNRPPEGKYIAEWTALLSEVKEPESMTKEYSVFIFRLGREWLALTNLVMSEVVEQRKIHTIPHRTNRILKGTVNLRGHLRLCVDLGNLLEVQPEDPQNDTKIPIVYKRMLGIKNEQDLWVFPVDEVYGVFHYETKELANVPVTVTKSTANYLKGIFQWSGNRSVGLLDEGLLFYSLRRAII